MARRPLVVLAALTAVAIGGVPVAGPAWADPTPTPSATSSPAAEAVDLKLVQAGSTAAPMPTQRGTTTSFGFVVQGGSPDATFTATLPDGMTFTDAYLNATTALTCTSTAGTVECPLGAVDGFANVSIGARIAATTPVGTHLQVVATVTPVPGPDANPADNTTTATVVISAHVDLTQTVPDGPVLVSEPGSGTFLYVLHNSGPEPVTGVQVTFRIFGTDAPLPSFEDFGSATVVGILGGRVWEAGTIPPGGTATLPITLHASAPVRDSQVSWSAAYDAVPTYCFQSASCTPSSVEIRSVPSESTGLGNPAPEPQLAATGSDNGPLTAVGLGLLLGGGLLTVAGRRRAL